MKISEENIKVDKNFECNMPLEHIADVMNMLSYKVYHDEILIADTTESMVEEYQELMGESYEEAAVKLLLSYSKDETLVSGIEEFAKKTECKYYPQAVDFELTERCVKKFNELHPRKDRSMSYEDLERLINED